MSKTVIEYIERLGVERRLNAKRTPEHDWATWMLHRFIRKPYRREVRDAAKAELS